MIFLSPSIMLLLELSERASAFIRQYSVSVYALDFGTTIFGGYSLIKVNHPSPSAHDALSSAEAPYGRFLNIARARRERWEEGKDRPPFSLSPSWHPPRAAVFPSPTAKKPLWSKKHERFLCGRESPRLHAYFMLHSHMSYRQLH